MALKRTANIKELLKKISQLCVNAEAIKIEIQEEKDKWKEKYDSRSKMWQESEKGIQMDSDIAELEDIDNTAQLIVDCLGDIEGQVESLYEE